VFMKLRDVSLVGSLTRPLRQWTRPAWKLVVEASAVVAVLVALVAWWFPRPGASPSGTAGAGGGISSSDRGYVSPSGSGTTPMTTDGTAPATGTRFLGDLVPAAGAGWLRARDGHALELSCPSNQSDDRLHEVRYALAGTYVRFDAAVTGTGDVDPQASMGVQVFVIERSDRTDRSRQVAGVVVVAGESAQLDADLTGVSTLVVRLTCQVPGGSVILDNPVITPAR
jgi:hypothetical protein